MRCEGRERPRATDRASGERECETGDSRPFSRRKRHAAENCVQTGPLPDWLHVESGPGGRVPSLCRDVRRMSRNERNRHTTKNEHFTPLSRLRTPVPDRSAVFFVSLGSACVPAPPAARSPALNLPVNLTAHVHRMARAETMHAVRYMPLRPLFLYLAFFVPAGLHTKSLAPSPLITLATKPPDGEMATLLT